jgi:N6-adenosine-specific RNA methylase IME4
MPKKYSLLLADPSWQYDNAQQNDPARGGIQYKTLSMEELYHLPIDKCANDDAILVCWVTFPKLMDEYYEKYNPISIIRKWNFRPVTALFVWIKTNKRGEAIYEDTNIEEYDDFYSGLGRYTNSNAEFAIVARRGKGLPRLAKNVKQLIFAPIGKHSAKPYVQYERLDKLYGNVSRVELFARDINPPPLEYDAVGLEFTPSIDIRDWIKQYD